MILPKTVKMNELGRELFRNLKFFGIGPETKKLRPLKVGDFLRNPENLGIFVQQIRDFGSKTVSIGILLEFGVWTVSSQICAGVKRSVTTDLTCVLANLNTFKENAENGFWSLALNFSEKNSKVDRWGGNSNSQILTPY